MNKDLTHFDADGKAIMVDVGDKKPTIRRAVAKGNVVMKPATLTRILENDIKKGDVLGVARLAGIMAAKKTSDLIPLCHPLMLTSISIDFKPIQVENSIEISAEVKVEGKTGVEMEALTAVSVAALTIYDMCKAIDKGMQIGPVLLDEKSGGMSGDFRREEREQT